MRRRVAAPAPVAARSEVAPPEVEAELVVDAADDAVSPMAAGAGTDAPAPPHVPLTLDDGDKDDGHAHRRVPPDHLDLLVLREELRRASARIARFEAVPEVLVDLDLPGLAALRTELTLAHAAALERIDDRRVLLQAHQAATQEGPDPGRCIACWVRKADRVLLPCRHLCLCGTCLNACRSKCPVCRCTVSDHIEVFGVS